MADFYDDQHEDIEYKLTDEDGSNDLMHEEAEKVKTESPEEPVIKKIDKRKWVVFIAGGALLLLIVLKLMTMFFSSSTQAQKPLKQARVVVDIQKPEQSVLPTVPVQSISPQAPSIADNATTDNAMTDKMTQLQQQNTQLTELLRQQAADNRERSVSLEQKIAGLESTLSDLQNTISDLSDQVKHNKSLQEALLTYQKNSQAAKNSRLRQIKQYFVQAVIPGRAWLHAADGTTMTVAVGDDIPGYGKVASIDAYSGAIMTNSGRQINYGLDS